MVSESKVLLIDVGNTQIKYCLLSQFDKEPEVSSSIECVFNYVNDKKIEYIYLSSVRNESFAQEIKKKYYDESVTVTQICTESEAFGIKNCYADVSKMGTDRWLAMVAAEKTTNKAFFVMDIGTAITVDFVADGQHLGGWITPGYTVMKDALINSTERVTAHDQIPTNFDIGQDTEDCVATGCFSAVYGVYLAAIDYLSSKQTDFDVIIGGGGKKMFAFLESDDSIRAANLVVQGLARYARRDLCVTFD
ncbi:type III pantothenate kinase [Alteromonas sp. KUL49]|uniref:type III pantothenate kinase n=1 Tax=Alteromonas sp. KUL49 TaxID=2480798 RepID=UPI00102EEB2A|nr:type III pantothenate kinase [Alteromonas sp. KUL49]TAP33881.1 type III pantothenate kinase [Alteromonas sp. KUL49]GEA13641.1 type III pantothenate kinase [Alteromonas sp. KUL49]